MIDDIVIVVWFGEMLNPETVQAAFDALEPVRTMIVVVTSALMQPAASLSLVVKRNSARLVAVNPDETPLSAYADEILRGPASLELPGWWARRCG